MRWSLLEVAGPEKEPVTLDEVKAHLHLDGDAEDGWLKGAIAAARQYAEGFQGRTYTTRMLRLSLERWPRCGAIYLPRPPLQSVESVTYTLEDGIEQTLDPSLYIVDTTSEPGAIHLHPGASWPSEPLRPGLPVTIEYTAGYGEPEAVPAQVRHSLLLLIGHWFANREAVVVGTVTRELEFTTEALLYPERVFYSGPEV